MPVPEGLESNPPGGLQDPLEQDIIDPKEVVIMPLYGIVQDSPLITAGQIAVRRLKRNEAKVQNDVGLVTDLVAPFLLKIEAQMLENKKKNNKKDK